MPKNRIQVLYNRLERQFADDEAAFLEAEKNRYALKNAYAAILESLVDAREKLQRYPQAAILKRLALIETLLKDLQMRFEGERRSFDALGYLMGRLRSQLASEILEPRLYGKIRKALENEATFAELRKKYPDSEAVVTEGVNPAKKIKADKTVRLLLVESKGLHYAIAISRLAKKTDANGPLAEKLIANGYRPKPLPAGSNEPIEHCHAIAYCDLKGERRMVYCDSYFTPVAVKQRDLKRRVVFASQKIGQSVEHRPYVTFYGRHFFVYGARLSYTVRTGAAGKPITSQP